MEEIGEALALMESIWISSNVSLVIKSPNASNKTKKKNYACRYFENPKNNCVRSLMTEIAFQLGEAFGKVFPREIVTLKKIISTKTKRK